MLGLKGTMPECPVEQQCLEWAHKYLKDCVCNSWDEISLSLGLLSVFSWGVAEVPQILTNFHAKSTEGISLAFLMTWVLGDVFNLAGCYLEPATLPTQFYMAVLYTFTTVVLVGQTIYYDYIYPRWHPELRRYEPIEDASEKPFKSDEEAQKPLSINAPGSSLTSTINVPPSRRGPTRDLYYASARSLASSYTPTMGSYLGGSRESGGQIQAFLRPSHDSGVLQDRGHGSVTRGDSSSSTLTGSLARTAGASILLVGSVGLSTNLLSGGSFSGFAQAAGQALRTGRRLMMATRQAGGSQAGFFPGFPRRTYFGETQSEGPWGEVLGWCMAAIYMGGRLPQILLNIKRGTVEGLNPLMFIFALVGNASYVASILVRTLDWGLIKPNMPWLVDAGVCVLLDFFIICQFVHYRHMSKRLVDLEGEDDKKGNYEAIR